MKILHIVMTGLFTGAVAPTGNPVADANADCGMAVTADTIAAKHAEHEHVFTAFSHAGGKNPNDNCANIAARIAVEAPDLIFVYGHSFGCSLAIFFFHWLARWYPDLTKKLRIVFFAFDPCLEPGRFGTLEWTVEKFVLLWHSWFQRNGLPAGVCGGGFFDPQPGGHNTDVSGKPNKAHGVTFGHIDGSDLINGNYQGIPQSELIRAEVYPLADYLIRLAP